MTGDEGTAYKTPDASCICIDYIFECVQLTSTLSLHCPDLTQVAKPHLDVCHCILHGSGPSESHHDGVVIPAQQAAGVQLGLPEQLMPI